MATLASELAAFAAALREQAPAAVLEAIERSTELLVRSGLTDRALRRGDRAPDFMLHDAVGDLVDSRKLRSRGPVVLCFYRGAWCPYCNLELRAWQRHLPEVQRLGATLLAISPQTPDASLTLAEKHSLAYPVLSDRANVIARSFGIVFTIDDGMRAILEGFGVRLPDYNGDSTYELPVPATYLVASDATIVGSWIDVDYRRRGEPSAVLARLRELVNPVCHRRAALASARSALR